MSHLLAPLGPDQRKQREKEMSSSSVIQIVVTPAQKKYLDERAKEQGVSASALGRLFITKAIDQAPDRDDEIAASLVAQGKAVDLAEGLKFARAFRGIWT